MKVSLVVATGAHEGKVIQITGQQFLIGRDAQCHLRPASQAISKHHCGVLVRDGQIYIKDYGSTNGTLVNDALIRGAEVMVVDGASLKLGPLDFIVRIELASLKPDGTPLPGDTPEAAATLAAVKAATGAVANAKPAPSRDATPNPALPNKPNKPNVAGGSKEAPALTGSKEAAALKSAASKSIPPKSAEVKQTPPKSAEAKPAPAEESTLPNTSQLTSEDDDKMAAMLLGMEDENVPDGSTVVDMPAVDEQGNPIPPSQAKPDDKAAKKVVAQTREEMSSAASDLLRKMMRRPK
jgi:predicted component of type VI protein secretion system